MQIQGFYLLTFLFSTWFHANFIDDKIVLTCSFQCLSCSVFLQMRYTVDMTSCVFPRRNSSNTTMDNVPLLHIQQKLFTDQLGQGCILNCLNYRQQSLIVLCVIYLLKLSLHISSVYFGLINLIRLLQHFLYHDTF